MHTRLIKQFAVCLSIFIVLTGMMLFAPQVHLGFFGHLATLVFGTLFTTVGVVIGDALRRFVKPDLIFASDGVELFRKKVFWWIGPQAIGWFIGFLAYQGLMRNVLGYVI